MKIVTCHILLNPLKRKIKNIKMNMYFLKFFSKTLFFPLKKFDILLITREKKMMIESDRTSRRVRLKRSQSLRRSTYITYKYVLNVTGRLFGWTSKSPYTYI